jgi:hypothetical protein
MRPVVFNTFVENSGRRTTYAYPESDKIGEWGVNRRSLIRRADSRSKNAARGVATVNYGFGLIHPSLRNEVVERQLTAGYK